VLLGLLFTFKQFALDSLNLNHESELVALMNNTNRREAIREFRSCPCADDIAPVFLSMQRWYKTAVEKNFR
jgi:hypothetical protein